MVKLVAVSLLTTRSVENTTFFSCFSTNLRKRAVFLESGRSDLAFDQAEAVVVFAGIELFAAGIAGDGSFEGSDAFDHNEAGRAGVCVVAFHFPSFEREVVIGAFSCDAEVRTGGLPLDAMGVDFSPSAAFVGDEVGEFVF